MSTAYSNNQLEVLKQPTTLIWIVMAGECIAAILALAPGPTTNRWVYFGLASLGIQWVGLLTLATLLALRRLLAGHSALVISVATLLALQALTWLTSGVILGLFGRYWQLSTRDWMALSLQLSGIALLIGLMGMAALNNHIRVRQLAVRAKQAEFDALVARVQPHFLFNALNAAATLVHREPDRVERILLDLSDLFRAALAGPAEVPIEDEIELARRYIEIESIRFGARMQVDWELPSPLPPLRLPRLSLQPLVENAVHHGIGNSATPGHIGISLRPQGDHWLLAVENSLPAEGEALPRHNGHHLGLSGLRARLAGSEHASLSTTASADRFQAVLQLR